MPHDPELVAETREWLVLAKKDLDVAAFMLTPSPPFAADSTFHAQQAAEKSLKAFLAWHQSPFRTPGDRKAFAESCLTFDASLRAAVDAVVALAEYEWKHRYPGDALDPPRDEAERALEQAGAVFGAVLARLPAEVRP